MGGGAERVLRDGMRAAGFDVGVDGTAWELTPRTTWVEDPPQNTDDITLDGGGVTVEVTLGTETRRGEVTATPLAHRFSMDTLPTHPFSVRCTPGESLRFEVTAVCAQRVDGKPLPRVLRRTLAAGTLTVPVDVHDMGGAGTGFVPVDGAYAFLHLAEVAGERRYVAAHMTFRCE